MRGRDVTRLAKWLSVASGILALLAFGCTLFYHSDSYYTPKAAADSSGGATLVYQDRKGGIFAQRLDPSGNAIWGKNGTLLGSSSGEAQGFPVFDIVADGAGGALIGWPDLSPTPLRPTEYVTKVSPEGAVLWRNDFVSYDRLIGDGTGGAIIAFDHHNGEVVVGSDESSIELVRIDSEGRYPWGLQGITIPRKGYWPTTLQLTGDGAGGAIVIWEEMETQRGLVLPNPTDTWRVMAQRVDTAGSLSWGDTGIVVTANSENTVIQEPGLTADGSGGGIIAVQQYASGKVVGRTPEWFLQDIIVQKIANGGNVSWPSGPVPLQITKNAELAEPHSPLLTSDGSGGAIVIWEDLRNGLSSIYAQRIGTDGSIQWVLGGVKVCYIKSAASTAFRQIVSDGLGGALVSCRFNELGTGKQGVLVQRLDSSGKTLWPGNGLVVTGKATTSHFLASDGHGGAIVAWGSDDPSQSYVQKIGGDGKLEWGNKGIRLDRQSCW